MEFTNLLHPAYKSLIQKNHIMKTIILSSVLIFATLITFSQQPRKITGKVVDEQGYVLPGVSVIIKDSQRGTVTDHHGMYQITVFPKDRYLIFSFVGMESQQVEIGNKTRIDITMVSSREALEEVVVAGTYRKPRVQLTSAISRVFTKKGKHYLPRMQCYTGAVPMGRESYASIHENGFKNVSASPLSTFSVDVDNASYSNVRRFINSGQLPPADAVRIEEMVNYFTYGYPQPTGKHPFSVTAELGECPWNKNHHLFHVGLKGKEIETGELPPSNLVFLLDVSGSMNAQNKLPLVKRAFKLLVNELRPSDKVSIVVYAGAAGLVLKPTPGNQKSKIINALENLEAGGSTAGGQGILLAYKTAKENFMDGGNNRIILATDGDFNVGVSSNSELEDLVEKERENRVFLTVLGFGQGNIQDDKMEILADKGNGNYVYIDNFLEARKVFISEFGGTLFTIAKDVKFQLEFNPQKVKAYRLVGYENRLLNDEDFNDDTKDAGEMGAGHTVTALYEIIPTGAASEIPSVDPLKYQESNPAKEKVSDEVLTIKVRYKEPDGNTSKLLEKAVMDKLSRQTSDDFRFSAAVASFGMLIRESEFKGNTSIDGVIKMAYGAKGEDTEGYRAEFIKMAKTAKHLAPVMAHEED